MPAPRSASAAGHTGRAAATHSVKGIKNIMSRDSTKMEASTELVAVAADILNSQAKHGTA